MKMQPQRSYTSRYLEIYPLEGESDAARQWYDTDNNLICYAAEKEVHEVARFFGYTPDQFGDLRGKIQVSMVNDHRRQMKEKSASSKNSLECEADQDPAQNPTFKRTGHHRVGIAAGVAIALYLLT